MVRAGDSSNPQGLWASHPGTAATHTAELRMPLTPAQLRVLEELPVHNGNVRLRLELRAAAAWLREEHRHILGTGGGAAVELLPLTWLRTDELHLAVPIGHWVEQVLPGLGADRYRTVLISLPSKSPLTPGKPLVRWFDEARARYDRGEYRGCIERCRDVRRAVETLLEAGKSDPVSAKAANAAGLPAGTTTFVDGVWRPLRRHQRGAPSRARRAGPQRRRRASGTAHHRRDARVPKRAAWTTCAAVVPRSPSGGVGRARLIIPRRHQAGATARGQRSSRSCRALP
jgi:hypothetical protein